MTGYDLRCLKVLICVVIFEEGQVWDTIFHSALQSKVSVRNPGWPSSTLFNKTLCWHKRTTLRAVLPSPIEVADGSCNNMAIRCIVLLHLTVFLLVDGEDLLTSS